MSVNRVTGLIGFLTVGYGLKARKATCPGGNSEEHENCVVRSWPPQSFRLSCV